MLTALGITAAVLVLFVGGPLLIARAIRGADQAAAPSPAALAALGVDNPGLLAVVDDDQYLEAVSAGRAVLDDDPTLTRMFAAWRDEVADDSAWRPPKRTAAEVLDERDRQ